MMDHTLAARRLSAALGRKIAEDEVEYVEKDIVCLLGGEGIYLLAGGNACYTGNGVWMRNGRLWDEVGEEGHALKRLDLG